MFVSFIYECSKWYFLEVLSFHKFFCFTWNFKVVFVDILMQVIVAENLHYFDELVEVVTAFEESVNFENHSGHSAPERPNVQAVVIRLVVYQQLRTFVVS